MSKDQLVAIDQEIRNRPAMTGLDLAGQREVFAARMAERGRSADVPTVLGALGGVPVVHIGDQDADDVVLYFHGGGYVLGSAPSMAGLAAFVGERAGARVISVDYRLAPEHPFPAAVDDALAAYRALLDSGVPAARIAFAGESAGGGLVVATLLAAREAGLPLPSSGVALSPWADLTLSGESLTNRGALDPSLSKEALAAFAALYFGAGDPSNPLISPMLADLTGLPPLLIQVGSNEVLLDDAIGLAARAAADEVEVRLEVTPGAPHVFQSYVDRLEEAVGALDSIGAFVRGRFVASISRVAAGASLS